MRIKLSELALAIGAKLIGSDAVITSISTDTRQIENGSLFVAIKGENRDGHEYIAEAFENGAVAAVSEKAAEGGSIILVKDTRLALGDIARLYRSKMNIRVVGITGSVGKTTTKDMVACVLAQKYNVLKTNGNFNNDIGVPLTLFRLEPENEVAVVEMGMNHFGELSYLTSISKPDVALITNVGVAHMENLGTREGILRAKCEIFEGMGNKPKIINGDNDMLATIRDKYENIKYFSVNDSSALVYAQKIETRGIYGIDCELVFQNQAIKVHISVPGEHMVSNALAAAAVGIEMGLNAEQIKQGIEAFKAPPMRMRIYEGESLTVIDDTYNANPDSTRAALNVLRLAEGKRCCVLGDMLELGEKSSQLHAEIGEYAVKQGADFIICVGKESRAMRDAAEKASDKALVLYFDSTDELLPRLTKLMANNKMTVLFKASRGMKFDELVKQLQADGLIESE